MGVGHAGKLICGVCRHESVGLEDFGVNRLMMLLETYHNIKDCENECDRLECYPNAHKRAVKSLKELKSIWPSEIFVFLEEHKDCPIFISSENFSSVEFEMIEGRWTSMGKDI